MLYHKIVCQVVCWLYVKDYISCDNFLYSMWVDSSWKLQNGGK